MYHCKMTPYEGKEEYIFVSYAHKDAETVLPILDELTERGYRVWYDEGITPGSEWPEYIAEHLNSSSVIMTFLSPASLESDNCRREITFALSRKINLLGIILEPVEMSLGMEMQLSAHQCVLRYKYSTFDAFIDKICSMPELERCCRAVRGKHVRPSADGTGTSAAAAGTRTASVFPQGTAASARAASGRKQGSAGTRSAAGAEDPEELQREYEEYLAAQRPRRTAGAASRADGRNRTRNPASDPGQQSTNGKIFAVLAIVIALALVTAVAVLYSVESGSGRSDGQYALPAGVTTAPAATPEPNLPTAALTPVPTQQPVSYTPQPLPTPEAVQQEAVAVTPDPSAETVPTPEETPYIYVPVPDAGQTAADPGASESGNTAYDGSAASGQDAAASAGAIEDLPGIVIGDSSSGDAGSTADPSVSGSAADSGSTADGSTATSEAQITVQ